MSGTEILLFVLLITFFISKTKFFVCSEIFEYTSTEGIREGSAEFVRRLRLLERETSVHLFWECRIVREALNRVLNRMCNTTGRVIDKQKYMSGWEVDSKRDMELILMIVHLIKYGIYKCKLRYIIPTFTNLWFELGEFINMLNKRQKWRESIRELSDIMGGILL